MSTLNRIAPALLTFLKRIALPILIILIFAAMVVFTAANPDDITIRFLHWEREWPAAIMLTVVFMFGWLFGLLCVAAYVLKLIRQRRKLRRQLEVSETEVSSLRNLPLADAD